MDGSGREGGRGVRGTGNGLQGFCLVRRMGGGVRGTDKGLQGVCLVGGGEGLVGRVLAPSTGRLPREGGSFEGAAPSRGRTTPYLERGVKPAFKPNLKPWI